LRELLTIPSHGAASVAEVQSLLEELPVSKKKDNGANWPYLEIRVEESQPEPGLLQRVNEILENRAVRFCRMVRQTHLQGAESETPIVSLESLRELQPLDMARSLFENKYHTGMPEVLVQRFLEAESEARQEP
jgi:exonuclease SbcD